MSAGEVLAVGDLVRVLDNSTSNHSVGDLGTVQRVTRDTVAVAVLYGPDKLPEFAPDDIVEFFRTHPEAPHMPLVQFYSTGSSLELVMRNLTGQADDIMRDLLGRRDDDDA